MGEITRVEAKKKEAIKGKAKNQGEREMYKE